MFLNKIKRTVKMLTIPAFIEKKATKTNSSKNPEKAEKDRVSD